MAFCKNCGSSQPDGTKFCTNCGAPIEETVNAVETANTAVPPVTDVNYGGANEHKFSGNFNYAPGAGEESMSTRGLAILSYIGLLALIPLFMKRDDEFVRFHLNQGVAMTLTMYALALLNNLVIGHIPFINGVYALALTVLSFVFFVFSILHNELFKTFDPGCFQHFV